MGSIRKPQRFPDDNFYKDLQASQKKNKESKQGLNHSDYADNNSVGLIDMFQVDDVTSPQNNGQNFKQSKNELKESLRNFKLRNSSQVSSILENNKMSQFSKK